MHSHTASLRIAVPRWYETSAFRKAAMVVLIAAAAAEGYVAICRRDNDFGGHFELGRRVLAHGLGEYVWGWYPASRVTMDAGLSLLPYRMARLLTYSLAIGSLIGCFHMWRGLVASRWCLRAEAALAAAVATLAATITIVQRDLEECGLHIIMLFFLTASAWCLAKKRAVGSGFWLGLAIAFKATPVILLPYLLWKRQWKATAWAIAFTLGFNLAPAFLFGWDATLAYHAHFIELARGSARVQDPCDNVVEGPKLHNQSWNTAIARLVQTYPPDHPLHVEHPWNLRLGNLDVDHARLVVKAATLLLLGAIAWRTRRAWQGTADLARDWAAAIVLPSLLSPLCWKQHLVVAVPAVFLIVIHHLQDRAAPRWRSVIFFLVAIVLLASAQGVSGERWANLALSYKVFTVAVLLAMLGVLALDCTGVGRAASLVSASPPTRPAIDHAA